MYTMSAESTLPELAVLSTKLGQLIRAGELKVGGKLLATARGHLQQLSQKEPAYHTRFEQMAKLRGQLTDPDRDGFDAKQLLVSLLDEEKELREVISLHPQDQAHQAHVLLTTTAAIVLVYCQDLESGAPLDF
jgi:hypothetical protein